MKRKLEVNGGSIENQGHRGPDVQLPSSHTSHSRVALQGPALSWFIPHPGQSKPYSVTVGSFLTSASFNQGETASPGSHLSHFPSQLEALISLGPGSSHHQDFQKTPTLMAPMCRDRSLGKGRPHGRPLPFISLGKGLDRPPATHSSSPLAFLIHSASCTESLWQAGTHEPGVSHVTGTQQARVRLQRGHQDSGTVVTAALRDKHRRTMPPPQSRMMRVVSKSALHFFLCVCA